MINLARLAINRTRALEISHLPIEIPGEHVETEFGAVLPRIRYVPLVPSTHGAARLATLEAERERLHAAIAADLIGGTP